MKKRGESDGVKWAREYREEERGSSVSLSSVRALLIWRQTLSLSPWRILAVCAPLTTNTITAHYWCTHTGKQTQRRGNNTLSKHSHTHMQKCLRKVFSKHKHTHTHSHAPRGVLTLCLQTKRYTYYNRSERRVTHFIEISWSYIWGLLFAFWIIRSLFSR